MKCNNCGNEVLEGEFCSQCGTKYGEDELKTDIPRTIVLVLGILGTVFGILGGVNALIFSGFAYSIAILGISAILASIIGLLGSIYVTKNSKYAGIILIMSAIWLLISISAFGILGSVLLGIAGIIALIRN